MGCSSSALNKAGESSRLRSVTSKEHFSTTEENESCVAQPKPSIPGRESTFPGNIQRESLPPLEKPKASVVPTANGVIALREQPLAKDEALGKDALGHSAPTEKTQPLERLEESEPPQPGGKDDTPGAEEKKKDVDIVVGVPPLKGNTETEPLGIEVKGQPSRTAGERDSPSAGEATENPQTVGVMNPVGTVENFPPLEAAGELPPQEAMGKDEQSQLLETIPKENKSSETLEGRQFVERVEEQQLQETLGNDEQSQLLETNLTENVTPERVDRSQLVQMPQMDDSLHNTPEGPGNTEQIQPEGRVGSVEHPAGVAEMLASVEEARKIHTNEGDQHTEGETGEKVEAEMENERVSEGAETKEEETGEAVDLSAAT